MPKTASSAPDVPPSILDAISRFRTLIEAGFGDRLLDVRLFGSHARGEPGPRSDVDVLVVIRDLVHRDRTSVYDLAFDVYADTRLRIAPFALSQAEWAELRARELLIAQDIERDGIAV